MRMNKFDKVVNEAFEGIKNTYNVAKQAATSPSLSPLVNIVSTFFSKKNQLKPVERASVESVLKNKLVTGTKEFLLNPVFSFDAVVLYDSNVKDKTPSDGTLVGKAVSQNDIIVREFIDFLQKNNYSIPPIGNNSGKKFWVVLSPKGNTTLNTILTKWQQIIQSFQGKQKSAQESSIIPENQQQYYTFYIAESIYPNNVGKFVISTNMKYLDIAQWDPQNTYLFIEDPNTNKEIHKIIPVKQKNNFSRLLQAGEGTAYGVWYFCSDLEKLQSKEKKGIEKTSGVDLSIPK